MIMTTAMRGVKRSLWVVLGLLLLSAACNAKKLWGVDVGKKDEEKGEFASLLQKATGQDGGSPGGGIGDEVGSALAALADVDLSQLSLSEICTSAIDIVLETVKDEQWIGQFAEPGMMGDAAKNPALAAILGDDDIDAWWKGDVLELLSLESSPILYKTKFYELVEQSIGKLVSLRMDVSDPAKLNRMVRDLLQTAGLDDATIAQIMEVVTHPEILAEQIKAITSDPAFMQQITGMMESYMTGMDAAAAAAAGVDEAQMMDIMAALENEDPEVLEQMLAEMMKDPAFAESMMMAEAEEEAGGGGGIFKGMGAGRPGQAVEL